MKKLMFFCVLFLFTSLFAEEVFQVGVINTLQLHPASTPVAGFKLNLVNSSTNNFTGLDVGFFSQVNNNFTGIQFNTVNFNEGNSVGIQLGEVLSASGSMTGAQLSPVNYVREDMVGLQMGFLNIITGGGQNFQLGMINYNENGFLKIFPFFNFSL